MYSITPLCIKIVFIVCQDSSLTSPAKTPKKIKVEVYKLTREQKDLIKKDEANKKVWDEAMGSLSLGPVRMDANLMKLNSQIANSQCHLE